MAGWKLLLLLALLASATWHQAAADEDGDGSDDAEDDDYADADRAHLIVRKYFKDELAVQGRNLTVYIDIYNAGASAATDVQLKDASPPAGFKIVEGSLKDSFAKLDVGAQASHSYVMLPEQGSKGYLLDPATVTYKAEYEGTEVQVGKSTRAGIYVMTPVERIQRYALNAGRYATLGMARSAADWRNLAIFLGVIGGLLGGNWAVKHALTARTTTRRNKALASLEKDQ